MKRSILTIVLGSSIGLLLCVTIVDHFANLPASQSPSAVYNANNATVVSTSENNQMTSPVERPAVVFPVDQSNPIQVMVFGDMMLDRTIAGVIGTNGLESLFTFVRPWIDSADITLANAEGVFTNNRSIAQTNHEILRFTFDPANLTTLKNIGFDLFGQANNHTADFGRAGLATSRKNIAESGITPVGDYYNDMPGPEYVTVGSTTVAFIAYNQFSYQHLDRVILAITEAKASSTFVIVFPHWGEEYVHTPTALQKKTGHAFIDAGADVVIGAHPHVVESIEKYKNKLIFYSLGNFIFDQHFSVDVTQGFAVRLNIKDQTVAYTILPYTITNGQPKPMEGEERAKMMRKIQGYSAQIGFNGATTTMMVSR